MKRTMRLLVSGLAICAASLAFAPQASAIDLTAASPGYLGTVTPGVPSSAEDEAGYINFLVGISSDPLGQTYNPTGYNCGGTCPEATDTGAFKNSTSGNTTVNLGAGFQYIVAKYDASNAGSMVWYIGGVAGTYTVPLNFLGGTQYEVSHISAYNGTGGGTGPGGGTPEPASLALFGLGLLAAGYRFRRRTV